MSNTLLTPTVIARESLMQLENNMVMGANVHRQYRHEFVKVGSSVTIRKPVKFVEKDGATLQKQDVTENSTSITISNRKHVGWGFLTQDLTLTIQDYSERYVEPAAIVLGNGVDMRLCTTASQNFWMSAGTPGLTPSTFAAVGNVAIKLDDAAVPDDHSRRLILNPDARWSLADALKGIFEATMAEDFIRGGRLGRLGNLQIFQDQNIVRHTVGAIGDNTAVVNEGSGMAEGDTAISLDGYSNSVPTLTAGDVFTVAGVNAVNPVSKADTGKLQQFVVTTAKTGSGNATADVAFLPEVRSSGAYQTVTALPADGAVVTFLGTASTAYPHNLAFHKNALALVMVPVQLPDAAVFKARVNHNGMSIRVIKAYDVVNDEEIIRLDILEGNAPIYPELGAKLWG